MHLPAEIDQWVDTLLEFSPLEQLERGLAAVQGREADETRLRAVLRGRHLAAEHFGHALKFPTTAPPTAPALPGADDDEKGTTVRALAGDQLTWETQRLEQLSRQVLAGADDLSRARAEFALAEEWASLRGRLLSQPGAYGEPSLEDRQRNARVAGHAAEAAARELESRDELQHALTNYLAAARHAGKDPLSARALSRANEALRLLAERSTWAAGRAFETNSGALSRQCFDRLSQELSLTPAERGANIWWSFRTPAEKPWTPHFVSGTSYAEEVLILRCFCPPAERDEQLADVPEDYAVWEEKLDAICKRAEQWESARLRAELEKLRADFHGALRGARGTVLLNELDDLILFLGEPELTPAARRSYFAFRLSAGDPAGDAPELKPWEDYVAFQELVRERGRRPMGERMQEFLAKYPHSHKREAAMARLAIALARKAHGHASVCDLAHQPPPRLPGGETVETSGPDPTAVTEARAALQTCARESPHGRYEADLRLWRGALAVDERAWPLALRNLTATVDDPGQADLHLDAALNLALLFLQLLEQPGERGALVAALRKDLPAQKRLWQFLRSDTVGARLRCMEGFLHEQLP